MVRRLNFFNGFQVGASNFEWLHPLGKGNQLDNQGKEVTMMLELLEVDVFFIVLNFFWLQGLYEIDHGFLRYAQSSMKQSLELTNMKDRKLALVIQSTLRQTSTAMLTLIILNLDGTIAMGEFLPASKATWKNIYSH